MPWLDLPLAHFSPPSSTRTNSIGYARASHVTTKIYWASQNKSVYLVAWKQEWQREVKTLSEEERGENELQVKASCQSLETKQSTAQHTLFLHPGWGKMGCFLLEVFFSGSIPNSMLWGHLPGVSSHLMVRALLCLWSPKHTRLRPAPLPQSHSRHMLPDCFCANAYTFSPLCTWGRGEGCFFFKRTVSALKKVLEISMFSRSLSSSWSGFVFVDLFPPWWFSCNLNMRQQLTSLSGCCHRQYWMFSPSLPSRFSSRVEPQR